MKGKNNDEEIKRLLTSKTQCGMPSKVDEKPRARSRVVLKLFNKNFIIFQGPKMAV